MSKEKNLSEKKLSEREQKVEAIREKTGCTRAAASQHLAAAERAAEEAAAAREQKGN